MTTMKETDPMNNPGSAALRTALAYYHAWTSHDLGKAMSYIADDIRRPRSSPGGPAIPVPGDDPHGLARPGPPGPVRGPAPVLLLGQHVVSAVLQE
jgi:hypothetical protein